MRARSSIPSIRVLAVVVVGKHSVWYGHLQVHWPVGQAHELPQLQVHPGPVRKVSVLLLTWAHFKMNIPMLRCGGFSMMVWKSVSARGCKGGGW